MTLLGHRVVISDHHVEPTGTLYILHGFLGSGRNWSSFASRLVERRSDWRIVLVDLRLHGSSRIADPPHDVGACARDLAELRDSLDDGTSCTAVLGHSFGGKVALEALRTLAPPAVQTWVIDSTPAPTSGEGSTRRMLQLLAASPEFFGDREEAVAWVAAGGFDEATARWMAMNLRRSDGHWHWDLDVAGLQDLLDSFGRSNLWSIVEADGPDRDIRFVQASMGSILTETDAERIRTSQDRFGTLSLAVLAGGHWLHMDNPEGMLGLLAKHLPPPQPS